MRISDWSSDVCSSDLESGMSEIVDDGGVASAARARIGETVRARLERNPMVSRIDAPHLEIYGRQEFLSAEECAGLRELIDAGAQPSTLFSGSANPDYRTGASCQLSPGTRPEETRSELQ